MHGAPRRVVKRCDGTDVTKPARTAVQEVTITSLAAGGDGVGRLDGMAVFVPRTAPGDVVSAAVRVHGRFARGTVRAMQHAAPERVDAPCVHFVRDHCGGCQWQHLSINAQREAKAQLVVDAFARIAKREIPKPQVHGDDRTLAYRRTISLTVRGHGAQRVGGFHSMHDADVIVPIERCLIAEPVLQAAWDAIRHNLARLPAPRPDNSTGKASPSVARDTSHIISRRGKHAASQVQSQVQSQVRSAPQSRSQVQVNSKSGRTERGEVRGTPGRGEVRDDLRVSVRALDSGDVALMVQGGTKWHGNDVALLAEGVPACSAVWWQPAGRETRLVWDRDATRSVPATAAAVSASTAATAAASTPTTASTTASTTSAASRDEALQLAASFVQVNRSIAAAMHSYVHDTVLLAKPRTVLDAYAGTGRLSIALAQAGVRVTTIESDTRAVAFTASQLPAGSRAISGRVEDTIAGGLPADVVVLNPPRAGVDAAVTTALSIAGREAGATPTDHVASPQLLVYVSCDPATLARDVARLSGWRIESVTCFDMFPQTSHVEIVCVLRPEIA